MAAFNKFVNLSKSVGLICKAINSLTINSTIISKTVSHVNNSSALAVFSSRKFHTSIANNGLMEFFDEKKNWGENEVRSGRAWKLDELRIKSNGDLHKLWFILLKEKNMLLTMEHECSEKAKVFPCPERIDKVNESMVNLETVVRERNKAYHLLETGETGERPTEVVTNELGFKFNYRYTEHLIPKQLNSVWKKRHNFNPRGAAVVKFQSLYREKLYNEKRKKRNRDKNHVMGLLKRFPNMDMEAVKAHYPDVDIEKCKSDPRARGHFVPK